MVKAFYLCGHAQCGYAGDGFGLNGKMVPLKENITLESKYSQFINIIIIVI